MIQSFLIGFKSPIAGVRLILSDSQLLRLSVLPFLVMTLAMILGFTYAFPSLAAYLVTLVPAFTGWMVVFGWLGMGLAYLLGFLGVAIVFVLFASVVASPFQGLLAEKTLMKLGALESKPFKIGEWLGFTIKMLIVAVERASIFAVVGLMLFVLSLIPIVQVGAGFLGLIIVALDCVDYSLELLGFGLRKRFTFLKQNFWELAGFGCCFGITFFVPLLNFFMLPAAVVGACIMVNDIKGRKAGLIDQR
ncbi:MAG: EI24 domain-containing protein [Bdellovibrionales bacterium]|nr:EI24 domain-containing protein [Bdellovibrionales bacterium]